MRVNLYNQTAEIVGEVELNPRVFGVKPAMHFLAEAVRVQMRNSRKGLAHTKTRGEVSGGGKKPWKQKGTGRARAGSTRGPVWRHGGVAFGPRSSRNWELKLNKKAKTKALFMSLSDKVKSGRIAVVESINLEQPKTKLLVKFLEHFNKALQIPGRGQLLVLPKKDESLMRAGNNLSELQTRLANSLNAVEVIKARHLIVLKDSLGVIEKTYLKTQSAKRQAQNAPAA